LKQTGYYYFEIIIILSLANYLVLYYIKEIVNYQ